MSDQDRPDSKDMEAYLDELGGSFEVTDADPERSGRRIGHVTASDGLQIGMDEHEVKAFVTTENRQNDVHVGDYVGVPFPKFSDDDEDLPENVLFTAVSGLEYDMETTLRDLSDIPGIQPDFEINEDDYPLIAQLDPITILRHERASEGDVVIDRGAVDQIPKPFESVELIEDKEYLFRGLNLPDHGIPLGHVAVSGDPVPRSMEKPLVYHFPNPDPSETEEPALWRHLLIAGSTGKGKTHTCKNILRQFAGGHGGPAYTVEDKHGTETTKELCTVILDPENEYAELANNPDPSELTPDDREVLDNADQQGFRVGGVDDLVAFIPVVNQVNPPSTAATNEIEFGIPFAVVKNRPDLLIPYSAQGPTRNAISRVVGGYFSTLDNDSDARYDDFMTWVRANEHEFTDDGEIHPQSWSAMMGRLSQRSFNDVFDQGQSLLEIEHEMFRPGRVSVIPTDHLTGPKERLVMMSLLAHIVDNKLDDQNPSEQVKHTPLLLVVDEAHNYLASRATTQQEYIVDRFVEAAKQGRKQRLGLGMVTQNPADIDEEIRNQTNTRIYLGLEDEVVDKIEIPRGFSDRIPLFGKGQMMIKAPDVQPTEVLGLPVCLTQHSS
ncbi:ATP-binding protein [Halobacteria archaeon AArc-curdl1]|uniref:ATP-binding protein n=1 Tax=Natronosalvus hydrolyticus TaxID=2979988 RepID=A0AAP3E771_9EURY|nr:ATP-binding protein [Halobacteria archaeon AArc-curdl1]